MKQPDQSESAIQPRTRKEREAFVSGYAQAVLDIQARGIEDAKAFLQVIAKPASDEEQQQGRDRQDEIWKDRAVEARLYAEKMVRDADNKVRRYGMDLLQILDGT